MLLNKLLDYYLQALFKQNLQGAAQIPLGATPAAPSLPTNTINAHRHQTVHYKRVDAALAGNDPASALRRVASW
ncbi:uncharacterized protein EKO05_0001300 [Ascochyta rabiei]|uniref:uncharacterized protein n=1 Tax=Didymella rabiei TaxID=5454 RepID=UPI00220F8E5D|nr:uncharacterized protein EKO05_0001300 [Ascochyta rabiei]UPX10656.1 hypothetical protein EKO05_0001300 [Ascochyta rabiei]